VKFTRLEIGGLGRLRNVDLTFGPGLNVIYGPNEAGKSTAIAALVAALYGFPRRDRSRDARRPWDGGPYVTTLHYELSDGRAFELRRDHARDARGASIRDRDGKNVAAEVTRERSIAPGLAHLQLPYDVFVNTACVVASDLSLDERRADPTASALAHALDGGPRDDAALGALGRLRDALKANVGSDRATVNAPLRHLRTQVAAVQTTYTQATAARDRLDEVRLAEQTARAEGRALRTRRENAHAEIRALRAADLAERLVGLADCTLTQASIDTDLEATHTPTTVDDHQRTALDAAYAAWNDAQTQANDAAKTAAQAREAADLAGTQARGGGGIGFTLAVWGTLALLIASLVAGVAQAWMLVGIGVALTALTASLASRGLQRRAALLRGERAASEQAETLRAAAAAANEKVREAGDAFDHLAEHMLGAVQGSRQERRDEAIRRHTLVRRREQLLTANAQLAARRSALLRGDTQATLEAERAALEALGVIAAPVADPQREAVLAMELTRLDDRIHALDLEVARRETERQLGESSIPDIAELGEALAQTQAELERLQAFERALNLALTTLEQATSDAHARYARRLETYAAPSLAAVSAGRYQEVRIDPRTLAMTVRAPEFGGLVELAQLSSGTADQIILAMRFAMGRMFAEGLEAPPFLLDEPFSSWDDERVARQLAGLATIAAGTQTIVATKSPTLAALAQAHGATRIDLPAPGAQSL
jgi:uncharacterized protein YhaN